MFANDVPQRLDKISTGLNAGNFNSVRREAHTIKGAAANLGGERTREAAYDLEKAADNTDTELCQKLYSRLFEEVELLLQEFSAFKDSHNSNDNLTAASGSA
jgi:HPt (histidine-containing phosphotransfer) domain-containing protein